MAGDAAWVLACKITDIKKEDVMKWEYGGMIFAIIRTGRDEYFTISGTCTHEYALMSDGFVDGDMIECPRHAACFDIRTGKALTPPARVNLSTFPTKVENGCVFVNIS
jgi:3-phenylpropionate/trans-cinnamate dioxygenase ferredoxin subunit